MLIKSIDRTSGGFSSFGQENKPKQIHHNTSAPDKEHKDQIIQRGCDNQDRSDAEDDENNEQLQFCGWSDRTEVLEKQIR